MRYVIADVNLARSDRFAETTVRFEILDRCYFLSLKESLVLNNMLFPSQAQETSYFSDVTIYVQKFLFLLHLSFLNVLSFNCF